MIMGWASSEKIKQDRFKIISDRGISEYDSVQRINSKTKRTWWIREIKPNGILIAVDAQKSSWRPQTSEFEPGEVELTPA